jgi:acetyl-CoA acetyltransferase
MTQWNPVWLVEIDGVVVDDARKRRGTGAGGIDLISDNVAVLNEKGTRRVAPTLIANMIDDAASGYIAIQTGALGPNMAIVAACSTGGHNIGEAYETIKRDDADVIIAGGAEAATFTVFRRSGEAPLYRIEKRPALARRQGAWAIMNQTGPVLKRGHELEQVLKVFDKGRFTVVE